MRVHLVAIGGSVMHNLALELGTQGHYVTGSDDEFYEPSRSRLAAAGLLPEESGWFPDKIDRSLDCVISGMHARKDNPEISRALQLGLRVVSFPEFYGERCKDKIRVVVAGSHGKTTTTAMIMHVLQKIGRDFDYLVGASLEGFERNVRLSDAPICVIEGDEYLSSPLDPRPKIMHYDPDVTIITGVAWDHMNVFPTWESYGKVFKDFISGLRSGTTLIWFAEDEVLKRLIEAYGSHLKSIPYRGIEVVRDGVRQESTILDEAVEKEREQESTIPDCEPSPEALAAGDREACLDEVLEKGRNQESTILDEAATTRVSDDHGNVFALKIFGAHNLQNMSAAGLACAEIGINQADFFQSMQSFTGAAMRLQMMSSRKGMDVYRDFAHAPSKVRATVNAIREKYPDTFLVAFFELHTFSSLNKAFLPQYDGAMSEADHVVIFYSPKTLQVKKLPPVSVTDITNAFNHHSLEVITSRKMFEERLTYFAGMQEETVLLLMSSGRFEGADLNAILQP